MHCLPPPGIDLRSVSVFRRACIREAVFHICPWPSHHVDVLPMRRLGAASCVRLAYRTSRVVKKSQRTLPLH
eukprot:2222797-Pyramimonas_sp.AAC.1